LNDAACVHATDCESSASGEKKWISAPQFAQRIDTGRVDEAAGGVARDGDA
jgi:hypothetical protein